MQIKYRKMTEADAKELAELDKACFSVPWSEQSFTDEASNPLANYLIAECEDEIVGYIGYWDIVGEGHITNVAVAEKHRRCGIASELLGNVIRDAWRRSMTILTLEVRKSNQAAIKLYSGMGFEIIGERKNYYTNPNENALIMTLTRDGN